jgi:glycine/D-amino acid oxidase-like deaminating enzyme
MKNLPINDEIKSKSCHVLWIAPSSNASFLLNNTNMTLLPIDPLNEAKIKEAITKYRPSILVVSVHRLADELLEYWRIKCPNKTLTILRRGSSAPDLDPEIAKKFHIHIVRTPGINAPFVAKKLWDFVAKDPNHQQQSLLNMGGGDIGRITALQGLDASIEVELWRRTEDEFKANDTLKKTKHIIINYPLTKETRHSISTRMIDSLPKGAILRCISEPGVFSEEALVHLSKRDDIEVIFDNAPRYKDDILQIIKGNWPDQWTYQSMVMKDCQTQMDAATLIAISFLSPPSPTLTSKKNPNHHPALIHMVCGAGITGFMTAYYLRKKNPYAAIFMIDPVLDSIPTSLPSSYQGASWRVLQEMPTGARHFSTTEGTLLPFPPDAKEAMMQPFEQGGWLSKNEEMHNKTEQKWIRDFKAQIQQPALTEQQARLAIFLNKQGMEQWRQLQKEHPQWFTDNPNHPVRLYPKGSESAQWWQAEQAIDPEAIHSIDPQSILPLKEVYPASAALEVEGDIFRIQSVMRNLYQWLKERGVIFITDHKLSAIHVEQEQSRVTMIGVKDQSQEHHITVDRLYLACGVGEHDIKFRADNPDYLKAYQAYQTRGGTQMVGGIWFHLPNEDGKKANEALKWQSKDPRIGVVNITVSEDGKYIEFSGGFLFLGTTNKESPSAHLLATLLKEETYPLLSKSWKAAEEQAKQLGYKNVPWCLCARPATTHLTAIIPIGDEKKPSVHLVSGANTAGAVQASIIPKIAVSPENHPFIYQTLLTNSACTVKEGSLPNLKARL